MSQLISHLNQYTQFYLSEWVMVMAVMAWLEGEDVEWVADLQSKLAWELADAGLFLEPLHVRFEDGSRVQWAEEDLLSLKQRGC